jgi:hypothetical protein
LFVAKVKSFAKAETPALKGSHSFTMEFEWPKVSVALLLSVLVSRTVHKYGAVFLWKNLSLKGKTIFYFCSDDLSG